MFSKKEMLLFFDTSVANENTKAFDVGDIIRSIRCILLPTNLGAEEADMKVGQYLT